MFQVNILKDFDAAFIKMHLKLKSRVGIRFPKKILFLLIVILPFILQSK